MTRDEIIHNLKENGLEVTFIKADGSVRVMKCTLNKRYLPEKQIAYIDEQHSKAENIDVVAAWDMEVNGWRSFRVDSIQYIQALTLSN